MTFKKGDKVTFEYAPGCEYPRLDLGNDHGASEIFGEGEVISIDENKFVVLFAVYPGTSSEHKGKWKFQFKDSSKPGYPKKVITPEEEKSINALHAWLNNSGD